MYLADLCAARAWDAPGAAPVREVQAAPTVEELRDAA